MRIWDLPPKYLCRQHLLGEHRELHALWTILTEQRKGYANHPETKRWVGKLGALYKRHEMLVEEMKVRKYTHSSPLNKEFSKSGDLQDTYIHTPEEQVQILKGKDCQCNIGKMIHDLDLTT